MSTFCKLSYHRKCKRRGVGGQKKTNLVNVVCERPLIGDVKHQAKSQIFPHKLLKGSSEKPAFFRIF